MNESRLSEIENYLSGRLTPDEREDFEKRMLLDADLREDVEVVKRVIEGIQGYEFRQRLKRIHDEHFGKNEQ